LWSDNLYILIKAKVVWVFATLEPSTLHFFLNGGGGYSKIHMLLRWYSFYTTIIGGGEFMICTP